MAGIAMAQAGIGAPVLVFPKDDDVFPFEDLNQMSAKIVWWFSEDRHLDLEIVDNGGRRWIVTGTMYAEPAKRRWWQLRAAAQPDLDIELRALEPQPFDAIRQRVEDQAVRLFDECDEALMAIRSAGSMAELAAACFEITARAQGRRIIAGDMTVPVRPEAVIARQAIVQFAAVMALWGEPRTKITLWLKEYDLLSALTASIRPSEYDLESEL